MSGVLPTPAPVPTPESEEFWAATAQGKLLLRRCDDCQTPIWYPRGFCPVCGSFRTSWSEASGRGVVYTFTVVHRSGVPGYREALPYVVAYVELEEGPRLLTNIVECEPDDVEVGMAVRVVFFDTGKGSALYRFAPAPS
ncbi:MAG TPA: Zn-ribbon domain-containing OB-fold protein [Acidimicrobiales bacterium]|nr:Zn-ribbon domain-containing OB-fold protein [Acidimicrobiales bacterium]